MMLIKKSAELCLMYFINLHKEAGLSSELGRGVKLQPLSRRCENLM